MKKYYAVVLLTLVLAGCSVYDTFQNINRLKFKLGDINNFKVLDISIENKKSYKDFSAMEIITLTSAVSKGDLPVSFTLNVIADNPNDGEGGGPRTDVSIESFPFTLFINEKETISGNIEKPVSVPGKGESEVFSLNISFDLMKMFKDKGIQELANLVLKIGGQGGDPSDLMIKAKPVLGTPLGKIDYPKELTIVSASFN